MKGAGRRRSRLRSTVAIAGLDGDLTVQPSVKPWRARSCNILRNEREGVQSSLKLTPSKLW